MKYVISNTGEPFQFSVSRNVVYSFDTEEAAAIDDEHYKLICERVGANCLKEVTAPAQSAPVEEPSNQD